MKLPNNLSLANLPNFQDEKTQRFTTLALTLIALSVFGVFAIGPTLSTIASLQKQLVDSQFVDRKLQEKITNLSLLQQQYQALTNDLPLILGAIPQTPTVTLLFAQLQSLASVNDVTLTRVQVSQVDLSQTAATPDQPSFIFSLEATGGKNALLEFLISLTNFERIITIDTYAFANDSDGNERLSLNGKAYFKN